MSTQTSAPMLRIVIEDLETGEKEVQEMPKGEYFILTTAPCYVAHTNTFLSKGTHVITVKGRTAG
jgi:hypothetical protein